MRREFASDNCSGILPKVFDAIKKANKGHAPSYGYDAITQKAITQFRSLFDANVEVCFVFNGTGANIIGLSALTQPHHSIICSKTAHVHTDECGAPEKHTGCKLIPLHTKDGKLTTDIIEKEFETIRIGDEHQSQPKVITITQSTELGTIYTPDEIDRLVTFAHTHNMYLHVDGARIANAVAGLGLNIRDITTNCGVDVLSFGGTKNGMMCGEAVIFFNNKLKSKVKFIRKQHMQLASKMRFISAQFSALLTDGLWLKAASKANKMAGLLAHEIEKIDQITITQKVEANEVFAILPKHIIPKLQEAFFFHVWNKKANEVRWVCSFDTTAEDIRNFISLIKNQLCN